MAGSRSQPSRTAFLVTGFAMTAAVVLADSRLVPGERMAQIAEVRDVRMAPDGTVSGVVVNHSDRPLRDVRLRVIYEFSWNDERSPGNDSLGRLEVDVIPGPIPPGGSVGFTHEPMQPLPDRADGRFEPHVEILDLLVVEEPERAALPTAPPDRVARGAWPSP